MKHNKLYLFHFKKKKTMKWLKLKQKMAKLKRNAEMYRYWDSIVHNNLQSGAKESWC